MRSIPCPLCESSHHRVISRFAGAYNFRAPTVICRECGFLFRAQPWDERDAARFRERLARHSGAGNGKATPLHETGAEEERRARRRLRWLRSYVPPPARVLGVGDGSDVFVEAASMAGYDASGTEPDRSDSSSGARQAGPRGQELLERWPAESFDAVAMFSVLEHVPDLHQAISTVRELLKPKGYLIIEASDTMGMEVRPKDYFSPDRNWHFTPRSLELLLAKEGLVGADILQRHTGDGNVLFAASRRGRAPAPDEICMRNALEYQRVLAYLQDARRNGRLTPGTLSRDVLSICLGPWVAMRAISAFEPLARLVARSAAHVPTEALLSDGAPIHDRAVP